jgi:putative DNA primase/helicase
MAKNLDQTGVVQVNGAWATSIRFQMNAEHRNGEGELDLRFMQGRAEVLRVVVPRGEVVELLGENNRAAIEKQILNAPQREEVIKGELSGPQLHYREFTLEATGPRVEANAIEVTRLRSVESNSTPSTAGLGAAARTSSDAAEAIDGPPTGTAPDRGEDGDKGRDEARRRAAAPEKPSAKKAEHAAVPDHIASKYLVRADKYHFDDRTVAFVDKGSKLTVETHNKAVIQDLIAIAKARDWQEIKVTGTETFRREVWKESYAAGLDVKGYKPSELELQAANKERVRRNGPNELSAEDRPPPGGQTPSVPSRPRNPGDQSKQEFFGTLVAHGDAPYQNDPTKSASYYVTLRDEAGRERTHWGVGLAEAMKNAQTAPVVGDQVGIQRVGVTPVIVPLAKVDAHGAVVTEQINAKRNQWVVEKIDYFKSGTASLSEAQARPTSSTAERPLASTTAEVDSKTVMPQGMTREQEVAAAIRSATTTREELQLKYPELNKAVFSHLASHDQFARAFVDAGLIRESDRAQVIAQMRERLAGQIERGAPIQEPDNKQIATVIRRSVNRVAADIGRPPVEVVAQRSAERVITPKTMVREDPQVRA